MHSLLRRISGIVIGAGLPALLALPAAAAPSRSRDTRTARPALPHSPPTRQALDASFGRLPLQFEVNRGQADPRVRYLTRGRGSTLFLTDDEAVWVLFRDEKAQTPAGESTGPDHREGLRDRGKRTSSVVRMRLEGSRPKPLIDGLERLPGNVNYFIGNDPKKWRTDVPTYRKVKVGEVYKGIDLLYYGNQRQVEYDFVVQPGFDPSVIRVAFAGAERISADPSGDLVIATGAGDLRMKSPLVYQERDGRRELVAAAYVVRPDEKKVEFRLAEYDRTRELVIDPVIVWSTFVGGTSAIAPDFVYSYDAAQGIAVGGDGSPIVGGLTWSNDFPTTSGAFDPGSAGDSWDGFVYKLNSAGTAFVYSTYIGGPAAWEGVFAVAAGASGEAFITGRSASGSFPVTPGAVNIPGTVFAAKLSAAGNQLLYSAFVGGMGDDLGYGIAVSGSGSAVVTGRTKDASFPTTPGALRDSSYYNYDRGTAFVFRLSPDGRSLAYCTLLNGKTAPGGPSGTTLAGSISVDAGGNAFVTGRTNAAADFPITPGTFQPTLLGTSDAFVTKLAPNGQASYSTYLGGGEDEAGTAIAVDSFGSAFVAGWTESHDAAIYIPPPFPTTPGAYISAGDSTASRFLTKLTPDGSGLAYSTRLIGGNCSIEIVALQVDARGAAIMGGTAQGELPYTPNSPRTGWLDLDPFVARVDPNGREVDFCIAFGEALAGGGTVVDEGTGLALGPGGDIFVAGETNLPYFPTTAGVVQPTYGGGGSDSFVVRIHPSLPVSISSVSPATGPSLGGTTITVTGSGFQAGAIVRLGGVPAAVSSVTPTSIAAVTGLHPDGVVDVSVENPDGGLVVLKNAFTYVCGGSAPTAFVSVGAGFPPPCPGESRVIYASLSGSAPWNLVWSDGFVQNGIASSPATRTVAPTVSTDYSVRIVTDAFCAGTSSGTAFIRVNPQPSAALTVPTRTCAGSAATASVPATTGANYAWTVTNGSIVSGQGTSSIMFLGSADPVTVSLVATLGTCSASSSAPVSFYTPPSGTLSGGGTVCSGDPATLSFSLSGTPPFVLQWSDGFSQTVNGTSGTRSVSPASTQAYTITSIADASLCPGGPVAGSALVTVVPRPSAAISSPASYCAGAAGLVASVPDAGPGATYAWTIAGGALGGPASSPSVTFTPSGATVVLGVTVTSAAGCTASSSRTLTLNPPPTAVVSGGGTVCAGSDGTIQAALTGTAPFSLTWSDGVVQGGVAGFVAQRTVRPAATTTYSVTSVQDASCSGSATGSATVTVAARPAARVTTPSTTICPGGRASITVSLSGPGPYTLTWSDGLVETVPGPERTRVVSPSATMTYSIRTVANGTCSSAGTGSSVVTVFPDANASAIAAAAETCEASTANVASVPDSGAGTTYAWTVTNGSISAGDGTRSVTWTAGAAGEAVLSVTIRAASGCEVSGSRRVLLNPRPAAPFISAPATLEAGQAGAAATVAAAGGSTYRWAIENGTIVSGGVSPTVVFNAGIPGVLTLTAWEKSPKGCESPAGRVEIRVRGLQATRLVPIVLDVAGPSGARYATELILSNPSASPVSILAEYTAADSLGAAGTGSVTDSLRPGEQRIIPDALAWLRAKGLAIPASGSAQGGTLRVTFEGLPAGILPSATTRTTVPSGAGRAGLSMPAVDPEAASSARVWLFGLRETTADRSHLALVNAGESGAVDLRVTLYSGAGASVPRHVLPTVRLARGQWTQLNSVLRIPGFESGYALVERLSGTVPFHAYAVFNDNATNDGSVVAGVAADRMKGTRMVPVVVETGAFLSELVLSNPAAVPVKASLWFTESLANPGGWSEGGATIDLAPGEQRIFPEILAELRRRGMEILPAKSDYAGSLSVGFSTIDGAAAEGWAGARTSTAAAGPGRFGLFCAAPVPDATRDEAWLFGLLQDGASRTNVAIVNAAVNRGPVTLRYTVFDGTSGTPVFTSDPTTLAPGAWLQLNGFLSRWKLASGYVRFERTAGSAPFVVYAVVNDGGAPGAGTGDGSFVEMVHLAR